jgi:hypothetical protein
MGASSSAGRSKSPSDESSLNSPVNPARVSLDLADREREPEGVKPAHSGNVRSLRSSEAGISTCGVIYLTDGYAAAAGRGLALRPFLVWPAMCVCRFDFCRVL